MTSKSSLDTHYLFIVLFLIMEESATQIQCVVRQIILWTTDQQVHNKHYILPMLISAVEEIEDPILTTYAKKLPIELIPAAVSSVFKDKTLNYGRLVSLIAFCAKMANLHKDNSKYLLELEEKFTKSIYCEMGAWFFNHKGWYGFKKFIESRREAKTSLKWTHFTVIALIMIFLIYHNIL